MRVVLDMRRIEPGQAAGSAHSQPRRRPIVHIESPETIERQCDTIAIRSTQNSPGTSSVSRSLSTPKLHLSGLVFISSEMSVGDFVLALASAGFAFDEPNSCIHLGPRLFGGACIAATASVLGCWLIGALLTSSFVAMVGRLMCLKVLKRYCWKLTKIRISV